MKRLNLSTVAIVMIAIFTSLSIATYAQPGGGNWGPPQGPRGGMNMLNLTDDQQTKVDEIKTAHMQEMLGTHNELRIKQAELTALQTAEKVDMKAVEAKINEIGTIKTKMHVSRATMHNEVRNLLDDEQKVKFDMHHANRPAGHRSPHGDRGKMGKGNKRMNNGDCNGNRKGNGKGNGRGNK